MPRPRVIPGFSAQVDAGRHPPLMGGKPSLRETLSQQAAESARLSDPRVHTAPPHAGRSHDPAPWPRPRASVSPTDLHRVFACSDFPIGPRALFFPCVSSRQRVGNVTRRTDSGACEVQLESRPKRSHIPESVRCLHRT